MCVDIHTRIDNIFKIKFDKSKTCHRYMMFKSEKKEMLFWCLIVRFNELRRF